MFKRTQRLLRLKQRMNFSTIQKSAAQSTKVQPKEFLQFSKKNLTDFGDLPQGVVPEALRYDLPFQSTQLKNGVNVATEVSKNSNIASLTVLIGTGTRFETLENSGVSQFIAKLSQRGTVSKSKEQVEQAIAGFGGSLEVEVGREQTTFTLSFDQSKLNEATAFLGDIILNPTLNKNQIEAEREGLYRQCVENQKDQKQTTTEAVHYTSFRDHFIGQPVLGIRENIANVTEQQIRDFHATHYVAQKITVVGAGNLSHDALVAASEQAFGKAPTQPKSLEVPNQERPYFTPSTMYMRDDEMANLNIGVFFDAPTYKDKDYYALQFVQRIMGEYQADKYTGAHLNAADRQYSQMHTELGNMPDVTLHKCDYFAYSDCGIFGNYLYGNEVFGTQMLYLSQFILTEYASYINHAEVSRAKNKYFNDLLNVQNSSEASKQIATQLHQIGRRVPRSEEAQRVSHFDTGLIQNAISKHFWDKEVSVAVWGPTHHLSAFSHYNRPIRRSTLGWYGSQHYRIL